MVASVARVSCGGVVKPGSSETLGINESHVHTRQFYNLIEVNLLTIYTSLIIYTLNYATDKHTHTRTHTLHKRNQIKLNVPVVNFRGLMIIVQVRNPICFPTEKVGNYLVHVHLHLKTSNCLYYCECKRRTDTCINI